MPFFTSGFNIHTSLSLNKISLSRILSTGGDLDLEIELEFEREGDLELELELDLEGDLELELERELNLDFNINFAFNKSALLIPIASIFGLPIP
ncbi:hypothetical protein EB093_08170 [bacterium]|nr:hypothetical protein [bacterium]